MKVWAIQKVGRGSSYAPRECDKKAHTFLFAHSILND